MNKPTIKIMFAGSIDDGKSTLIGRLLWSKHKIKEDILESIARDSVHYCEGDELNWALVADGLKSEREQGITIDVAHIYTETDYGYIHILDCPGHAEYTKNMIVAASVADIAVLLVDVSRGITEQTIRHLEILRLLQVPRIILAINKCDLIDWNEEKIREIENLIPGIFRSIHISALLGINLDQLDKAIEDAILDIGKEKKANDSILIVTGGICFNGSERTYRVKQLSGQLDTNKLQRNVRSNTSFKITKVRHTITGPDSISQLTLPTNEFIISLDTEIDVQVGDIITNSDKFVANDQNIKAVFYRLSREDFILGEKEYILIGTDSIDNICSIDRIDKDNGILKQYESATVEFSTRDKLQLLYPYGQLSRTMGNYILIKPDTNETAGFFLIQ